MQQGKPLSKPSNSMESCKLKNLKKNKKILTYPPYIFLGRRNQTLFFLAWPGTFACPENFSPALQKKLPALQNKLLSGRYDVKITCPNWLFKFFTCPGQALMSSPDIYIYMLLRSLVTYWGGGWYQCSYASGRMDQGLTLRFEPRGPKRSFDKNSCQLQDFWVIYILFRAPSLKNLGDHSKI